MAQDHFISSMFATLTKIDSSIYLYSSYSFRSAVFNMLVIIALTAALTTEVNMTLYYTMMLKYMFLYQVTNSG